MKQSQIPRACHTFGPFDWMMTSQSELLLAERQGMSQGMLHSAWLWTSVDFDDMVNLTSLSANVIEHMSY